LSFAAYNDTPYEMNDLFRRNRSSEMKFVSDIKKKIANNQSLENQDLFHLFFSLDIQKVQEYFSIERWSDLQIIKATLNLEEHHVLTQDNKTSECYLNFHNINNALSKKLCINNSLLYQMGLKRGDNILSDVTQEFENPLQQSKNIAIKGWWNSINQISKKDPQDRTMEDFYSYIEIAMQMQYGNLPNWFNKKVEINFSKQLKDARQYNFLQQFSEKLSLQDAKQIIENNKQVIDTIRENISNIENHHPINYDSMAEIYSNQKLLIGQDYIICKAYI
jgi:hypothetical protein